MPRLPPWLLAPLLALVVTAPAWTRPDHVYGAPNQEADNHLWMHWSAVMTDGPQLNWPLGEGRLLLDRVHLLITGWAMPASPTGAYLLLALASVTLAGLGGYVLSRELGAERGPALVGLTVLATAPVLSGVHVHGLTEDWTLGLYALHLAALLRTARTGSVRDALLASLALAGFLHSGWYATLFAALGSPAALWVAAQRHPDRRTWALLLGSGALAVLTVLPALYVFLDTPHLGEVSDRPLAPWQDQPSWFVGTPPPPPPWGADLATFLLPRPDNTTFPRTVYLGLVTSALAGFAVWRVPRARRPLLAAVVLLAIALGPFVTAFGRSWLPAPLPGPAALLLALSDSLHAVAGWYRATGPAMVWLAAVAALGAQALPRLPLWGLVALVGVDALLLSDAPWPRPHYDPRPPTALTDLPGEGAVLLLPLDRGQTEWAPHVPRLYQRWQVWMGRPLANAYEAPMALGDDPVVRWAAERCDGPRTASLRPLPQQRPPADASTLAKAGVSTVVVLTDRVADPERCAALPTVLGEATQSDSVLIYSTSSGER